MRRTGCNFSDAIKAVRWRAGKGEGGRDVMVLFQRLNLWLWDVQLIERCYKWRWLFVCLLLLCDWELSVGLIILIIVSCVVYCKLIINVRAFQHNSTPKCNVMNVKYLNYKYYITIIC